MARLGPALCPRRLRAGAPAAFDSPIHARWNQRFWTGECKSLPWTCMPGEPNWNSVVDRLVAKAQAAQKAAVKVQACRLGGLIGHEWSRAKPVRRIDTADLQAFLREVNAAPDVGQGLTRVEHRVRSKLSAPRD
ncbi:hypothetical protein [Phenylobacterium sp. J367]|uniref:hypothetical protein n=1 Tax=Phenylobacterium sp. J367 TaxID=2898435 RepID=UPI002151353A|nr:hypothetical protein [Phenylobacterium sp. J367]MCR5879750.1 hypothetical protein [Phenylobacterium sp. J367]